MIKLIVNDVELDLKSDTVVALTKKSVEIGNFQNRWSSYTNKFVVPATKKNRNALGIKQFQDASGTQYQYQNGKLISGGLEIASNVLVIIEEVSKDITLTLRAGNGGLFDLMNKTNLSDLDWSALNHTWNMISVYIDSDRDYTTGYVYPLHQTGVQSNSKNTVIPQGILPFLYVKKAFELIENYFGYKFTGDTFTLQAFEKLVYPIANLNVSHDFTSGYTYWANLSAAVLADSVTITTPGMYTTVLAYFVKTSIVSDPKNLQRTFKNIYADGIPRLGYKMLFTGVYKCEVSYSVTYRNAIGPFGINPTASIGIGYQVWTTGQTSYVKRIVLPTPTLTSQTATGTFTFDFTLEELNWTDSDVNLLGVRVEHKGCDIFTINSGYFKITNVLGEKTAYNRPIEIKSMQPQITIGKFIKEVGNIYGAIYDVDEFKKTIEITRLDEIVENKAIAIDWSDKLDLSQEIVTTYKLDGIAKNMVMQWNDDKNYAKTITVNNSQLPEKDDYIKSDAEYSLEAKVCLYPDSVGLIDLWNEDNARIDTDGKLRFLSIYDNTTTTIYYPSAAGGTSAENQFKVAYFYNDAYPNTLDWDNLYQTYYQDLIEPMTNRIQVVECFIKLNDLDIQSFRFKYPVYIKTFNRYFFVNEISEYTNKAQSTKVVLVGI